MGEPHHGPWDPLDVSEVASLFEAAPFTWFIAGGHALELELGRSWRDHSDIDVGIRRDELQVVRGFLADWDLHVAAAGQLSPWNGRTLTTDQHENNVWAQRDAESPWQLDLIVGAGTRAVWQSRRDPSTRVAWKDAVRYSGTVPYLAPHVQLLMKSKDVRPKDDLDASILLPTLDSTERRWLAAHLADDHPWQGLVDQQGVGATPRTCPAPSAGGVAKSTHHAQPGHPTDLVRTIAEVGREGADTGRCMQPRFASGGRDAQPRRPGDVQADTVRARR